MKASERKSSQFRKHLQSSRRNWGEGDFAVASVSGTSTPPLAKGSKILCGMHSTLEKSYPTLRPENEERGPHLCCHSQAD